MKDVYAVIDTNVLVSALLNWDSVPGIVLRESLEGRIIPLICDEIIAEYKEVLSRKKFSFPQDETETVIDGIIKRGLIIEPTDDHEDLIDSEDVIFYSVTMEARQGLDSYLVTGNIKHFPIRSFVVTPKEMLFILGTLSD